MEPIRLFCIQIRKTSVLSLGAQNFAAPRFLRPSAALEIHSGLRRACVVTSPSATLLHQEMALACSGAYALDSIEIGLRGD